MRTVFFGSPPFAEPSFRALLEGGLKPVALVTAPPRRAGRGRKEVPNPLVALAEEHDVEVLRPARARDADFLEALRALAPELGVVVSYGQILPAELLAIPRQGCINLHGSLLPRWRGASPVQAAILAGDEESGVCLQRVVEELDAGPVLAERRVALAEDERADELFQRLAWLGAELLVEFLGTLGDGTLPEGRPQEESAVTACRKVRPPDGVIDWSASAQHVDRLVRAMWGWPWARTHLPEGPEVRILAGQPVESVPVPGADGLSASPPDAVPQASTLAPVPGEVLSRDGGLFVTCGDGIYRVDRLQRAGKAALDAADFLRGARLRVGDRLS